MLAISTVLTIGNTVDNTQKTTYFYKDENRNILYSKIRKFNTVTQEKTFSITPKLNGGRKVLYRYPELLYFKNKQPNFLVFLVEGEKDVDTLIPALIQNGIIATATTALTSLEWDDSDTTFFEKTDVVILYDNDKTGIKRKNLLGSKLYGKVGRLRVVDLPGLEYRESHGLDISDWLAIEGNTIQAFMALVENTPDYKPDEDDISATDKILKTISIDELFNLELPEREMLLHPFLPSQGLVMLVAKRGVGKTHIALGIAYTIATGSTFLSWTAPEPKKVLYVDGEMPATLMKERLQMLSTMFPSIPSGEYLQIITPDLQDQPMPDLSRPEGRKLLEEYIKDFDLVILDNISCLFRTGYENESDSWQEAQEWALDQRRQGKSVMFVHHAGKSGLQRGTSKREDILDAVLILKHSDDYKSEDGARFEVHFDKARHFTGEDARSFQVHLQSNGLRWWWEMFDAPHEQEIDKIAQLKKDGFTIKAICEQTKLTKAQVEYRLKKAKEKQ